jgi:DeoR/GlpR family transcriptional regulator of sugar metabolism
LDDFDEGNLKKAMQSAVRRTLVLTDSDRNGRRALHHALDLGESDQVNTDAKADQVANQVAAGGSVIHA